MPAERRRGAYSLKRRLLGWLLGLVALVWAVAAAYTWFEARHEAEELLDAHLAQAASLLVAQVGADSDEIDLEHAPSTHEAARRVSFQFWEGGTVLRLHSANAPQARLSDREEGFSTRVVDGRAWRVFSSWDAQRRYLVQVGERDEVRGEIATGLAAGLLFPLLIALPLIGLIVWLSVGAAMAPLDRLGRELRERPAGDLRKLAFPGAPDEIEPLVGSLNGLFERLDRLIEGERRFTADAAHELRTPLAALKTQAQVARGAHDDAGRLRAIDSVVAGADRAARLVEQLLALARLDREPSGLERVRVDLSGLAREVAAEIAPAALDKGMDIDLAADAPALVDGNPDLIRVMLRNLMDNAVRYGSRDGKVGVTVEGASVVVEDDGPGVPESERPRLGQRFYRALETNAAGSGLGLSIARRIAEIHGAHIEFGAGREGRGLRVAVSFALPGA